MLQSGNQPITDLRMSAQVLEKPATPILNAPEPPKKFKNGSIGWVGCKATSGVCDYLKPIVRAARYFFPGEYILPFGGALGTVYNLRPKSYLALDNEQVLAGYHNWVLRGGKLWPTGVMGNDIFYTNRDLFNKLRANYLDDFEFYDVPERKSDRVYGLMTRPVSEFENWELPGFLTEIQTVLDTYDESIDDSYIDFFKTQSAQQIYDAVHELHGNPSLKGLSLGAAHLHNMKVDLERQLYTLFQWLNKNSYNNLYRVNSKNDLNAPCKNLKKPMNATQGFMDAHRKFLRRGKYYHDTFENVFDYMKVESGNIFYFDPPYAPSRSASAKDKKAFTSYTRNGFSLEDQIQVAQVAQQLVVMGNLVIASNSDNEEVVQLYADHGFEIRYVEAKRRVSCKGKERKPVLEMFAIGNPSPDFDVPDIWDESNEWREMPTGEDS